MAIDTTTPRSRRSLLTGVLAGTAAAVAGSLASARHVLGVGGDDGTPIVVAGLYDDAQETTRILNNTNNQDTFRAVNNQAGVGVDAYSLSGRGVWGASGSAQGVGVYGSNGGSGGTAIKGRKGNQGIAIEALNEDPNSTSPALASTTLGSGAAVYATSEKGIGVHAFANSPGWSSIVGLKEVAGDAIVGLIVDPDSSSSAVVASTEGNGSAIRAESARGRGGRFSGKLAQIRLMPSTATTHPTSGTRGDLFVDKRGRLWFCKGSTNWKQLA